MKKNITLFSIIISMIFTNSLFAQDKEISIIDLAKDADQYEEIQYNGIEVSQIVNFSNLVRVYINKESVVMVDNNPVAFDKTGETITKLFISDVEGRYGKLTPENIGQADCELKLLVRKSALTNRDDYGALLEMVNEAIWGLQKYYCKKVYSKEYYDLSQGQKNSINRLVPLKNLLAKDNTD